MESQFLRVFKSRSEQIDIVFGLYVIDGCKNFDVPLRTKMIQAISPSMIDGKTAAVLCHWHESEEYDESHQCFSS